MYMEYKVVKQRTRSKRNIEFARLLNKQFNLSALCADYLISKGITDIDSAERFLQPKLSHMYDCFSFRNMKKAVERIRNAVDNNEKVVIYADYDCDGVCAAVILYKTLKYLGGDVRVFIPNRFSDGYGMNIDAVKRLAEDKTDLIITVDNGITAIEEIKLASSFGIDVILTDHHEPLTELPNAHALIDPKCSNDAYPFDEICGATVALKLSEALGVESEALHNELIVFAAVATIADLVPLIDENRTIAYLGLNIISENYNLGLTKLIEKCALNNINNISASDVSFKIAPRINACGRLLSADYAFELFTTDDAERIDELAKLLDDTNEERKKIEEDICSQAENYLLENSLLATQKVLFIPIQGGHEGVNGIAAGKICEKYARPVIVGSISDGIVKASARSIPGFNIHEALMSCFALYIKFGGHSQAAGFTITEENFKIATDLVNLHASKMGIDRALIKHVFYDMESSGAFVTKEAVLQMQAFAPYGIKNPKPVFRFENARINNVSLIGDSRQHVRCNITADGNTFSGIGFSMASEFEMLDLAKSYDVLFTPSINTFRGISNVQLELKDIQQNIAVSDEYYESLYDHFYVNNNSPVDYKPKSEQIVNTNVEEIIDLHPGSVLICYGKDMLIHVIRYTNHKCMKLNISYKELNYEENSVNLLVNPTNSDLTNISQEIFVLDIPCFCGYESRFYENNEKVTFLRGERYLPSVFIDREYIVFIYKKIPVLNSIGNDIEKFIKYLNSESDVQVNYFLLRICFDILAELGIIDYEIISEKLYVTFNKISGVKDIYTSVVMQKIIKAYS